MADSMMKLRVAMFIFVMLQAVDTAKCTNENTKPHNPVSSSNSTEEQPDNECEEAASLETKDVFRNLDAIKFGQKKKENEECQSENLVSCLEKFIEDKPHEGSNQLSELYKALEKFIRMLKILRKAPKDLYDESKIIAIITKVTGQINKYHLKATGHPSATFKKISPMLHQRKTSDEISPDKQPKKRSADYGSSKLDSFEEIAKTLDNIADDYTSEDKSDPYVVSLVFNSSPNKKKNQFRRATVDENLFPPRISLGENIWSYPTTPIESKKDELANQMSNPMSYPTFYGYYGMYPPESNNQNIDDSYPNQYTPNFGGSKSKRTDSRTKSTSKDGKNIDGKRRALLEGKTREDVQREIVDTLKKLLPIVEKMDGIYKFSDVSNDNFGKIISDIGTYKGNALNPDDVKMAAKLSTFLTPEVFHEYFDKANGEVFLDKTLNTMPRDLPNIHTIIKEMEDYIQKDKNKKLINVKNIDDDDPIKKKRYLLRVLKQMKEAFKKTDWERAGISPSMLRTLGMSKEIVHNPSEKYTFNDRLSMLPLEAMASKPEKFYKFFDRDGPKYHDLLFKRRYDEKNVDEVIKALENSLPLDKLSDDDDVHTDRKDMLDLLNKLEPLLKQFVLNHSVECDLPEDQKLEVINAFRGEDKNLVATLLGMDKNPDHFQKGFDPKMASMLYEMIYGKKVCRVKPEKIKQIITRLQKNLPDSDSRGQDNNSRRSNLDQINLKNSVVVKSSEEQNKLFECLFRVGPMIRDHYHFLEKIIRDENNQFSDQDKKSATRLFILGRHVKDFVKEFGQEVSLDFYKEIHDDSNPAHLKKIRESLEKIEGFVRANNDTFDTSTITESPITREMILEGQNETNVDNTKMFNLIRDYLQRGRKPPESHRRSGDDDMEITAEEARKLLTPIILSYNPTLKPEDIEITPDQIQMLKSHVGLSKKMPMYYSTLEQIIQDNSGKFTDYDKEIAVMLFVIYREQPDFVSGFGNATGNIYYKLIVDGSKPAKKSLEKIKEYVQKNGKSPLEIAVKDNPISYKMITGQENNSQPMPTPEALKLTKEFLMRNRQPPENIQGGRRSDDSNDFKNHLRELVTGLNPLLQKFVDVFPDKIPVKLHDTLELIVKDESDKFSPEDKKLAQELLDLEKTPEKFDEMLGKKRGPEVYNLIFKRHGIPLQRHEELLFEKYLGPEAGRRTEIFKENVTDVETHVIKIPLNISELTPQQKRLVRLIKKIQPLMDKFASYNPSESIEINEMLETILNDTSGVFNPKDKKAAEDILEVLKNPNIFTDIFGTENGPSIYKIFIKSVRTSTTSSLNFQTTSIPGVTKMVEELTTTVPAGGERRSNDSPEKPDPTTTNSNETEQKRIIDLLKKLPSLMSKCDESYSNATFHPLNKTLEMIIKDAKNIFTPKEKKTAKEWMKLVKHPEIIDKYFKSGSTIFEILILLNPNGRPTEDEIQQCIELFESYLPGATTPKSDEDKDEQKPNNIGEKYPLSEATEEQKKTIELLDNLKPIITKYLEKYPKNETSLPNILETIKTDDTFTPNEKKIAEQISTLMKNPKKLTKIFGYITGPYIYELLVINREKMILPKILDECFEVLEQYLPTKTIEVTTNTPTETPTEKNVNGDRRNADDEPKEIQKKTSEPTLTTPNKTANEPTFIQQKVIEMVDNLQPIIEKHMSKNPIAQNLTMVEILKIITKDKTTYAPKERKIVKYALGYVKNPDIIVDSFKEGRKIYEILFENKVNVTKPENIAIAQNLMKESLKQPSDEEITIDERINQPSSSNTETEEVKDEKETTTDATCIDEGSTEVILNISEDEPTFDLETEPKVIYDEERRNLQDMPVEKEDKPLSPKDLENLKDDLTKVVTKWWINRDAPDDELKQTTQKVISKLRKYTPQGFPKYPNDSEDPIIILHKIMLVLQIPVSHMTETTGNIVVDNKRRNRLRILKEWVNHNWPKEVENINMYKKDYGRHYGYFIPHIGPSGDATAPAITEPRKTYSEETSENTESAETNPEITDLLDYASKLYNEYTTLPEMLQDKDTRNKIVGVPYVTEHTYTWTQSADTMSKYVTVQPEMPYLDTTKTPHKNVIPEIKPQQKSTTLAPEAEDMVGGDRRNGDDDLVITTPTSLTTTSIPTKIQVLHPQLQTLLPEVNDEITEFLQKVHPLITKYHHIYETAEPSPTNQTFERIKLDETGKFSPEEKAIAEELFGMCNNPDILKDKFGPKNGQTVQQLIDYMVQSHHEHPTHYHQTMNLIKQALSTTSATFGVDSTTIKTTLEPAADKNNGDRRSGDDDLEVRKTTTLPTTEAIRRTEILESVKTIPGISTKTKELEPELKVLNDSAYIKKIIYKVRPLLDKYVENHPAQYGSINKTFEGITNDNSGIFNPDDKKTAAEILQISGNPRELEEKFGPEKGRTIYTLFIKMIEQYLPTEPDKMTHIPKPITIQHSGEEDPTTLTTLVPELTETTTPLGVAGDRRNIDDDLQVTKTTTSTSPGPKVETSSDKTVLPKTEEEAKEFLHKVEPLIDKYFEKYQTLQPGNLRKSFELIKSDDSGQFNPHEKELAKELIQIFQHPESSDKIYETNRFKIMQIIIDMIENKEPTGVPTNFKTTEKKDFYVPETTTITTTSTTEGVNRRNDDDYLKVTDRKYTTTPSILDETSTSETQQKISRKTIVPGVKSKSHKVKTSPRIKTLPSKEEIKYLKELLHKVQPLLDKYVENYQPQAGPINNTFEVIKTDYSGKFSPDDKETADKIEQLCENPKILENTYGPITGPKVRQFINDMIESYLHPTTSTPNYQTTVKVLEEYITQTKTTDIMSKSTTWKPDLTTHFTKQTTDDAYFETTTFVTTTDSDVNGDRRSGDDDLVVAKATTELPSTTTEKFNTTPEKTSGFKPTFPKMFQEISTNRTTVESPVSEMTSEMEHSIHLETSTQKYSPELTKEDVVHTFTESPTSIRTVSLQSFKSKPELKRISYTRRQKTTTPRTGIKHIKGIYKTVTRDYVSEKPTEITKLSPERRTTVLDYSTVKTTAKFIHEAPDDTVLLSKEKTPGISEGTTASTTVKVEEITTDHNQRPTTVEVTASRRQYDTTSKQRIETTAPHHQPMNTTPKIIYATENSPIEEEEVKKTTVTKYEETSAKPTKKKEIIEPNKYNRKEYYRAMFLPPSNTESIVKEDTEHFTETPQTKHTVIEETQPTIKLTSVQTIQPTSSTILSTKLQEIFKETIMTDAPTKTNEVTESTTPTYPDTTMSYELEDMFMETTSTITPIKEEIVILLHTTEKATTTFEATDVDKESDNSLSEYETEVPEVVEKTTVPTIEIEIIQDEDVTTTTTTTVQPIFETTPEVPSTTSSKMKEEIMITQPNPASIIEEHEIPITVTQVNPTTKFKERSKPKIIQQNMYQPSKPQYQTSYKDEITYPIPYQHYKTPTRPSPSNYEDMYYKTQQKPSYKKPYENTYSSYYKTPQQPTYLPAYEETYTYQPSKPKKQPTYYKTDEYEEIPTSYSQYKTPYHQSNSNNFEKTYVSPNPYYKTYFEQPSYSSGYKPNYVPQQRDRSHTLQHKYIPQYVTIRPTIVQSKKPIKQLLEEKTYRDRPAYVLPYTKPVTKVMETEPKLTTVTPKIPKTTVTETITPMKETRRAFASTKKPTLRPEDTRTNSTTTPCEENDEDHPGDRRFIDDENDAVIQMKSDDETGKPKEYTFKIKLTEGFKTFLKALQSKNCCTSACSNCKCICN